MGTSLLFLVEGEGDLGHEGAVLAVLVHGHEATALVLHILQLLKVGVGVAVEHEVES